MDISFHSLDRHFDLPRIRTVQASSPIEWLRKGWDDLGGNPLASISYGVFFSVLGYFIMAHLIDKPYLATAAVSGFLLVGPVASAGLYEISRHRAQGKPIGLKESLVGLSRHIRHLSYFGLFLAFVLLSWERVSAILFALFYRDDIASIEQFFSTVLLSGDYLGFVLTYLVVGGVLAALVYTLSAVSIPMLMDRDTDMVTAMMTSAQAVAGNLRPMMQWAVLIVLLVALGFATMMVAMVVVLPWLGHASWHAYRDLVD